MFRDRGRFRLFRMSCRKSAVSWIAIRLGSPLAANNNFSTRGSNRYEPGTPRSPSCSRQAFERLPPPHLRRQPLQEGCSPSFATVSQKKSARMTHPGRDERSEPGGSRHFRNPVMFSSPRSRRFRQDVLRCAKNQWQLHDDAERGVARLGRTGAMPDGICPTTPRVPIKLHDTHHHTHCPAARRR